MKLALVGPGAFGAKHLDALSAIEGVEVVTIVGPHLAQAKALAKQFGIPNTDSNLEQALSRADIDAAILTSPSQLHAAQAMTCLRAEKHVAVEIPAGENWPEIYALSKLAARTIKVCSVGHTRRYNPPHQWVKRKIEAEEFSILHMDVQTFFFRRENINALGNPRDWTDHLLWHHAAHTVDLFLYQTGEDIVRANIMAGPVNKALGIAMDMSIQMQTQSGRILTLALSFNNEGPHGTFFRYIGDTGTYIARYDDLLTGNGHQIDLSETNVSVNGIELQNRDFVDCIKTGRTPVSSIHSVLPCYEWLRDLEIQLRDQGNVFH